MKRRTVILGLLILICAGGARLAGLQAQAAPKSPAQKPKNPPAPVKSGPAPGKPWKSKTTGKEYRVWTEGQAFHAEWTNVPKEFAARGAYIRTVCKRTGKKWAGESESYLPCMVEEGNKGRISNFCRVTTAFEVDSMTDARISGRGEALKRFDCSTCKVLEKEWKSYVWIPKK